MSHGLNAQKMDDLPHGHFFFSHVADTGHVALTWKQSMGQSSSCAHDATNLSNETNGPYRQ